MKKDICLSKIIHGLNTRKHKIDHDFNYVVFTSIENVNTEVWNQLAGDELFLSTTYLQLVEHTSSAKERFRYVVLCKQDIPVMIFYFQIIDFPVSIFGDKVGTKIAESYFMGSTSISKMFDNHGKRIKLKLIALGNHFITGSLGYKKIDAISNLQAEELVQLICDKLSKGIGRNTVSIFVVKDIFNAERKDVFEEYTGFFVEPEMELTIPESIKTFEEFTTLYEKKYRQRSKQIIAKREAITIKSLSLKDIALHADEIHALYKQVFNKADFKFVELPSNYWETAKELFPKEFMLYGFYKENKLVAFQSAYLNYGELEAHFIGIDYSLNKELELYQNILYHYVELAILNNCNKIYYGRTACEMKSNIGAVPVNYYSYVKPLHSLSERFVKPFVKELKPTTWTQRSPFKGH